MQVSGYGRQNYLRDNEVFPRVTAEQVEESVNKSLARLGTDHIDLLQARDSTWAMLCARWRLVSTVVQAAILWHCYTFSAFRGGKGCMGIPH